MPSNVAVRVVAEAGASVAERLEVGLRRIREELDLPAAFPDEVEAEARAAASADRPRHDAGDAAEGTAREDATDLELISIDPEGSMDLDQALHIARLDEDGAAARYLVSYAIADVAAFVRPGGAVDAEARRRGETLYGAGDRIPLHPAVLSEAGASLLPEQERPALLWRLWLDATGQVVDTDVRRARVRSRERWSYVAAQAALDEGTAPRVLQLLREVGLLRQAIADERGAISLPLPEQEVDVVDGRFVLSFRAALPVEEWNAEISLMTGMAAARMMLDAGVGLLRTLPPADPRDVARLRRVAAGLRIAWPADEDYPWLVRGLDPTLPAHQAMAVACTRLLRGSGYTTLGAQPEPAQPEPDQPEPGQPEPDQPEPDQPEPDPQIHAAIAAPYTHVTAPLRRLVDRFTGEVCVALCAGREVPAWVRDALVDLPDLMRDSGRRAGSFEKAVFDLIEAGSLLGREGEEFRAVVTSVDEERPGRGVALVEEIGVEARLEAGDDRPLPLGEAVTVRLTTADLDARRVVFTR